jgi:hypothetical protein
MSRIILLAGVASRFGTVDELCLHFAGIAERRPASFVLRHPGEL